jgi:hypothetical protein
MKMLAVECLTDTLFFSIRICRPNMVSYVFVVPCSCMFVYVRTFVSKSFALEASQWILGTGGLHTGTQKCPKTHFFTSFN